MLYNLFVLNEYKGILFSVWSRTSVLKEQHAAPEPQVGDPWFRGSSLTSVSESEQYKRPQESSVSHSLSSISFLFKNCKDKSMFLLNFSHILVALSLKMKPFDTSSKNNEAITISQHFEGATFVNLTRKSSETYDHHQDYIP